VQREREGEVMTFDKDAWKALLGCLEAIQGLQQGQVMMTKVMLSKVDMEVRMMQARKDAESEAVQAELDELELRSLQADSLPGWRDLVARTESRGEQIEACVAEAKRTLGL
jgi:hypothetical protein